MADDERPHVTRASTTPTGIGVFARMFPRPTSAAVADAVAAAGFDSVQLNLNCCGLPTIPTSDELRDIDLGRIRDDFASRGVSIWGVSATYNMIDPDRDKRDELTRRTAEFIRHVPELGTDYVTICTGTRDPANMWRSHPDNGTEAAWTDLHESLGPLLAAAGSAGVSLGIEPESANVVGDAATAARLLRELGSDSGSVQIVLDPANLLTVDQAAEQRSILSGAFAVLRDQIVCIHAKDVVRSGYAAAGTGILDYDLILDLRSRLPREVPLVVQDAAEEDSRRVRELLASGLARHPWTGS
jgi:sugar phosphate isomerase/epimerase